MGQEDQIDTDQKQGDQVLSGEAFDDHPLPSGRWPEFWARRPDRVLAVCPDTAPQEMQRLARHHSDSVRKDLARNPAIPPDVQARLAADVHDVQISLARNPAITEELVGRILQTGSSRMLLALASNPALGPAGQLVLLRKRPLRTALARNPALLPEMFELFAQSAVLDLRAAVAGNPGAGPVVLSPLAQDAHPDVRRRAAGNPGLAARQQMLLLRDPEPEVRWALSGNPSLAAAAQEAFARSGDQQLARLLDNRALTRKALSLIRPADDRTTAKLLAHPLLDPERQRAAARQGNGDQRRALAGNPSLDPQAQRVLADAGDARVLGALAGNAALLPEVQRQIARTGIAWHQVALLNNPALDRAALRVMLDVLRVRGTSRLRDLSPRPPAALGVATYWVPEHLDHPVKGPMIALLSGKSNVLDAASKHPDPLVRWALLANERITGAGLQALVADEHRVIRTAAAGLFVGRLAS